MASFPSENEDVTRRFSPPGEAEGPPSPDLDDATVVHGTGVEAGAVVPRRIAHYVLEKELGRGGQGYVYLARDSRLQRRVALKVLSAAMAFSAEARIRFEREAEIASRLDHPGLCTVHEIGEDGGVAYIAMQLVEGESLAGKIKKARSAGDELELETSEPSQTTPTTASQASGRRRDRSSVIEMMEGVARALHEAHEAGLVHRDIKPGNIIVTPTGRGVVLDFGLATAEDIGRDYTRTGLAMGTPTYMPPEQIRGDWDLVDRRADVYALGVTLFECLTLQVPFSAPTMDTLMAAVMKEPLPDPMKLNPRITKDLKVVLETATDKDLGRRYATAADFADELRRVRVYEPVRARPAGIPLRVKRWLQRNPILATSLAVIFVVMVAAQALVLSALQDKVAALDEKDLAVRDYESMADAKRAAQAVSEADALWPARPELREGMRAWLSRYRPLSESLASHRANLAAVRSDVAAGHGDADLLAWKEDVLAGLVVSLERLTAPEDGVIAEIRRRLEFVDELEQKTIVDHREAWHDTIEDIASSERYGGLRISPIVGLIPLRVDPESELHEFLDYESHQGPLPERNEDGVIGVGEKTGVVFVLIPGGTFMMGRSDDPESEWYEASVKTDEGPPHEVTLDAFLFSKYEMTRGQWRRLSGGDDPSHWTAEKGREFIDARVELLPVENVSWDACKDLFRRYEMTFPTEAQWEYAARAGATTRFAFGDDPSRIDEFDNLADRAFGLITGGNRHNEDSDDGFGLTAPVGSFEPNRFGIYDVHGNVSEWCLCRYGSYELPVRPGTGERIVENGGHRTQKGGHYGFTSLLARLSDRTHFMPSYTVNIVGVRAAMNLPK